MTRLIAVFLSLGLMLGCTQESLNDPLLPMGDFSLGHNVVVASKARKGPITRSATEEEWVSALTGAFARRFGRYEGEELYHLGVSVEGYMLAPPGLPVVYKPRSALILNVTVWDDAAGRKLNDEPYQMTIFEDTDAGSFLVGSGTVRKKEQQIAGLASNAAVDIEEWMSLMHQQNRWFTDDPVFNPKQPEQETKER